MDRTRLVRQKLRQLRSETEHLSAADFHHLGIRQCLLDIASVVRSDIRLLDRLDEETQEQKIQHSLGQINSDIARLHRVLGIILRSTNPRNSFEIFDPLLRVTRDLLGPNAMLVLSSEWEFSPFAEPHVLQEYPDYAFVGLPVMESANSLVVPLAGHEIGHAVWRSEDPDVQAKRSRFRSDILTATENTLLSSIGSLRKHRPRISEQGVRKGVRRAGWGRFVRAVTERICEEIFCDFIGVRVFGDSYLFAFLYLTSPHVGPTDVAQYPRWRDRALYLVWMRRRLRLGEMACEAERPLAFSRWFSEPRVPTDGEEFYPSYLPWEEFLLDQSHNVARRLLPEVKSMALWACERQPRACIPLPTRAEAQEVYRRFRHGVPADTVRRRGMADIINAGWQAFLDPELWHGRQKWQERKLHFINELVFKSLDVLEFDERTRYQERANDAVEIG